MTNWNPPTWIDLNGNSMPYPGHVYSSLVTLLSSKRNRCDFGSKRRFLFLNESMLLDAEYTSSNQTMSESLLRRLATECSTKIIQSTSVDLAAAGFRWQSWIEEIRWGNSVKLIKQIQFANAKHANNHPIYSIWTSSQSQQTHIQHTDIHT